jgi:hypothetical protein
MREHKRRRGSRVRARKYADVSTNKHQKRRKRRGDPATVVAVVKQVTKNSQRIKVGNLLVIKRKLKTTKARRASSGDGYGYGCVSILSSIRSLSTKNSALRVSSTAQQPRASASSSARMYAAARCALRTSSYALLARSSTLKLQAPPRRSWFARTFEARTQASREKKDLARKANFVFRRCAAQQGRGSGSELARRHGFFEENALDRV